MAKLFKNKYRVESARHPVWDYSSSGAYFITICTKDRKHFLGNIEKEKIILSQTGLIAAKYWKEIPAHFPNTELDEFIIMPNHIHGIILINDNVPVETPNLGVSMTATTTMMNLKIHLGLIINQYKRICTINIRKTNDYFAWQSRFYDRIIRDNDELNRIRNYIINNPLNWEHDEEYSD